MTRYGTIINGTLTPAPRRITLDGWTVINPTDEQYAATGYLPAIYTDAPIAPDGYYPVAHWEEQDGAIVQVWQLEELPPEPEHIPAWDISQAEYFNAGDLVTRDGVTYRCTTGHYAAWAKQPPNESYWEVADNDSIT